jgi:hypothetical protein
VSIAERYRGAAECILQRILDRPVGKRGDLNFALGQRLTGALLDPVIANDDNRDRGGDGADPAQDRLADGAPLARREARPRARDTGASRSSAKLSRAAASIWSKASSSARTSASAALIWRRREVSSSPSS